MLTTTRQLWVICIKVRAIGCRCCDVNRGTNGSGEKPSTSLKPPIAPFEARGVDGIMRSRDSSEATELKASKKGNNGSVEAAPEESLHDRLQAHRPKALKAWMDFRVSVSKAWNWGWRKPRMCLFSCAWRS